MFLHSLAYLDFIFHMFFVSFKHVLLFKPISSFFLQVLFFVVQNVQREDEGYVGLPAMLSWDSSSDAPSSLQRNSQHFWRSSSPGKPQLGKVAVEIFGTLFFRKGVLTHIFYHKHYLRCFYRFLSRFPGPGSSIQ